jgi:acyl-CoA synthetase (NDP forming)
MSFASLVLQGLKEADFPAIYPVNPKYDDVLGLRCYPDLVSIPGVVDHVVVSIPAESAMALLDECAAKGVKSVHFFTAGFGESGFEARAELERQMLERARAAGFRIVGPNCVGLFVPRSRLVNTIGAPLEPGPIAFLSQSGGHAQELPADGGPRGLRFSKVVSYGNALDVDESELLGYLDQDSETEIIAAYIEGVKDGRRFLSVLREAAARKPVVIYKGGRTEAGRRAALGHTASLTSSVAVFEGVCRQTNSIQVESLDEMIDVLVALRFVNPLPRGRRVALIGAGGGPSVLAGDEIEKAGLKMPQLSKEVQEELRSHFIIVYHLGFHPITRWGYGRFASTAFVEAMIASLIEVREATGKPVLLAMRPPLEVNGLNEFLTAQEALVKAGLPVFHSLRDGAKAMSRVVAWGHAHERS